MAQDSSVLLETATETTPPLAAERCCAPGRSGCCPTGTPAHPCRWQLQGDNDIVSSASA